MKTMFKISISVNLILLGCLAFMVTHGQKQVIQATPVLSMAAPPANEVAPAAPQTAPATEAKPYPWSQIESTDYPTYIRNLRSMGCPESTVRDITAGDADRAFFRMRSELRLDGSGAGPWSRQQESQLVASLMGDRPASQFAMRDAADATAPSQSQADQPGNTRVSLPLVFQKIDLAKLNLTDEQIQAIASLRQSFLDKLGPPNQDPRDPAYLARWQKAQSVTDDMLRGFIGINAFLDYQLQAATAAQNELVGNPSFN